MTTPVLRGSTAPLPGRPDGTPFGQNTLQATSPDSTLVGDLVLCVTWHGLSSATGSALTLRSGEGWTQLVNYFHDDGSSDGCLGIAWKIATQAGAQVYQAFNDTGGFEWADARTALRIYEVDTFDTTSITASTPVSFTDGNLAPDPGNISGLDAIRDYVIEAIGGWWGNSETVSQSPGAPSGFGNLIEQAASPVWGWLELALANKAVSGVTSFDTPTFTDNVTSSNNNGSVAVSVAIRGAEGTLRRSVITQAEFEVPETNVERQAVVTQVEFEIPNVKIPNSLTFLFHRSWARYRFQADTPVSPPEDPTRQAIVTQSEFEVPDATRYPIVSHAELEVPNLSTEIVIGVSSSGSTDNYTNWLGRPMMYNLAWTNNSSWTNLGNSAWTQWTPWLDADPTRFMNVGVGICISGTTCRTVAEGLAAAETAYRNLATKIIQVYRNRPHVLRIGWEMDGDWYPWKCRNVNTPVPDNYNYFGAAFRNIVTWMNSQQPTNQFRYVICPTSEMGRTAYGSPRATGQLAFLNNVWPGDSYVYGVWVDTYDMWGAGYPIPSGASQATIDSRREQHWDQEEADLNVLSGFAQTHGKPTGLGEWGVVITDTGIGGSTNPLFGMGGGDNPGYIQHIYDWMLANGTTHSSHYDENLTSQYHKISPPDNTTRYPLASVRFKDLFG